MPRDAEYADESLISLTHLTTLGTAGDSGALSTPPFIAVDSRSRYYVITPDEAQAPLVFNSDGQFLRSLGSLGGGPGEYARPRAVFTDEQDSVYVLDRGNGRRLTVLSPEYEVVRTAVGLRSAYDVVRRVDGDFFLDYQQPLDSAVHQFDRRGNIVRSFGHAAGLCSRCSGPGYALASDATGDLIGIQRVLEYRIVWWDSVGTPRRTFPIVADWFPRSDSLQMPTPDTPPSPQVLGAWMDTRRQLWIIGMAGADDWTRGLGPATRGEGGIYYPVEEYATVFDGIIEVVNLETQAVVAHRRLRAHSGVLRVAPDVIAGLREDSDGWWYADIYRVALGESSK